MRDPFPIPPGYLSAIAEEYVAGPLHLATLPAHIHEIVFAFALYESLRIVSALVFPRLLPATYPRLPRRTRLSWDLHVVSLVQSLVICTLAFYVLRADAGIDRGSWQGRIFGYSGATGFVQAMAAGYFAWDTYVSVLHFGILGPGSLAHGICALVITIMGFVRSTPSSAGCLDDD